MKISPADSTKAQTLRKYLLVLLAAALIASCGGPAETPEDRVRALFTAMEQTAEQGKALEFKNYIAADYSDTEGRGQRDVLRLVMGYKLRNKSIHLLVHIAQIDVTADERSATAEVYVAMAGSPLTGVAQLSAMQADLYRFDIELKADSNGNFKVTSGRWQPATHEDFISD